MKKKYTFEQVVRLLKRHAGDREQYIFEHAETESCYAQRASSRCGMGGDFISFEEKKEGVWCGDPRPFCDDGWELVRPVKMKRERVKVGGIDPDGHLTINGYNTSMLGVGYDLYAVKR